MIIVYGGDHLELRGKPLSGDTEVSPSALITTLDPQWIPEPDGSALIRLGSRLLCQSEQFYTDFR